MECIRHTRRRNTYAAGGTRLLAIASALVLPSTLMSISATPSAFMMAPSSRPLCRCAEQTSFARRGTTLRRALPHDGGAHYDEKRRRNGRRGVRMLWSGGRRTKGNEVTVNIERPSINSRRISGSIVIDRPIEDVWLTLTDYDRLAEYVPNLTQSKLKPSGDGRLRLWQEGAQNIVGFNFRASVEMSMEEQFGDPENRMSQKKLRFGLLESSMFNQFDGEWRMQFNSRKQQKDGKPIYTTKLFYMVNIKPKGPVPVLALEWQISNEVPNNLSALKKATEGATPEYIEMRHRERQESRKSRSMVPGLLRSQGDGEVGSIIEGSDGARSGAEAYIARAPGDSDVPYALDWDTDETLEAYIAKG